MGVGADHQRRQAIEAVAHGLLLAARLGMDVDDGGLHGAAEGVALQLRLHGAERVIQRIHEQPAHDVDDQGLTAIIQHRHEGAAAWRAGGEVHRADDPVLGLQVGDDLLAVPGVVAQGDDIAAGQEEGARHVRREAEAVAGILAIHDHQFGAELGPQAG